MVRCIQGVWGLWPLSVFGKISPNLSTRQGLILLLVAAVMADFVRVCIMVLWFIEDSTMYPRTLLERFNFCVTCSLM